MAWSLLTAAMEEMYWPLVKALKASHSMPGRSPPPINIPVFLQDGGEFSHRCPSVKPNVPRKGHKDPLGLGLERRVSSKGQWSDSPLGSYLASKTSAKRHVLTKTRSMREDVLCEEEKEKCGVFPPP